MKNFLEENKEIIKLILEVNETVENNPLLAQKLETINNEQEGFELIQTYTGKNYSVDDISKMIIVGEKFISYLDNDNKELDEKALDIVVGGLSWNGFWKRVGLSFKIIGEGLLILSAANPQGDFKGRVNMATDLEKKIKQDIKAFKEAK